MTREIINANQAEILTFLASVIDTTRTDLIEKTGIRGRQYDNAMTDLKERELVWATPRYGRITCRISVTMKGIRALQDYADYKAEADRQELAKADRGNRMKATEYKPAPFSYPRSNCGTSHIPSRGPF